MLKPTPSTQGLCISRLYYAVIMTTTISVEPTMLTRSRKRRMSPCKIEGKKFVCESAGCGRSFTRAEHLQRHLLNHSTGAYTCNRCRAHFKRRDLLGKAKLPLPDAQGLWYPKMMPIHHSNPRMNSDSGFVSRNLLSKDFYHLTHGGASRSLLITVKPRMDI